MRIVVYGNPAPQGSKAFKGLSKAGHGILVESSKAVKPWREAVKWAAMEEMNRLLQAQVTMAPDVAMIHGPVEMRVTFTLPKPKSAPKRRRTWPDRTPDLSKLVRSTEDALSEVQAWEDDARVVECTAAKRYPGEGPDALHIPGAVIVINPVKE